MNGFKVKSAYTDGTEWSKLDNEKRMSTIKNGLMYGIMMRGQNKLDGGIMQEVTNGVNDYLLEEYPSLRDKEFAYIVALGISGELGQETFICGASLMRWVKIYCNNAERIKLIESKRNEPEPEKAPDYDEANEKACNDSIHQLFEYYRRNNTIFGDERDEEGNVVKRGVFLPKWAGQIYLYYREKGKITEATDIEREVADLRAQHALSVKGVFVLGKHIYMKAEKCDWVNAFLLEQYFANVLKRQIES